MVSAQAAILRVSSIFCFLSSEIVIRNQKLLTETCHDLQNIGLRNQVRVTISELQKYCRICTRASESGTEPEPKTKMSLVSDDDK